MTLTDQLCLTFSAPDVVTVELHQKFSYQVNLTNVSGQEIINGIPDTLKGSYYNNLLLDKPKVSAEELKGNVTSHETLNHTNQNRFSPVPLHFITHIDPINDLIDHAFPTDVLAIAENE